MTSSPKTLPKVRAPTLVSVLVWTCSHSSTCSFTTFAVPTQRMNMDLPSVSCSMMRSPGMKTRMDPYLIISLRKAWEVFAKMDRSRKILITLSLLCARSFMCCRVANIGMKMSRSTGNSSKARPITPRCKMVTKQVSMTFITDFFQKWSPEMIEPGPNSESSSPSCSFAAVTLPTAGSNNCARPRLILHRLMLPSGSGGCMFLWKVSSVMMSPTANIRSSRCASQKSRKALLRPRSLKRCSPKTGISATLSGGKTSSCLQSRKGSTNCRSFSKFANKRRKVFRCKVRTSHILCATTVTVRMVEMPSTA
mmetsp:Transcript_64114/g.130517  ORF Transcript_64114/g.130517 Transcript_64114/m.130517 type:complete len:308 (+) Transcript_64114:1394-2317(+)